jgi:2-oxoglutarate ferredoxin oxidoreductase subunit gamma
MDRYEIILSGSGGQGIILAAIILAEAAGVYNGYHVCQTQSYGPEARGGYSKAEVVIGKKPLDYPKAIKADLLLTMNQASCDHYFNTLKSDGLLIADTTLVSQIPTERCIAIPFTEIARRDLGKEMVANMVALGAIGHISSLISLEHLEQALLSRIPKGTEELNQSALRAGIKAAEAIDMGSLPKTITRDEDEI